MGSAEQHCKIITATSPKMCLYNCLSTCEMSVVPSMSIRDFGRCLQQLGSNFANRQSRETVRHSIPGKRKRVLLKLVPLEVSFTE